MLKKGFIQIYTGNGKGKTTAAIGQALRAAGYGLKTYFVMFMKDYHYSELKALARFNDLITINQFGNDSFVFKKEEPSEEIKKEIKLGIEKAYNAMQSNNFDLIILDESLVSIYFGLITIEELTPFFTDKPDNVELILTGRYCPQELIDMADLVTEMKEIKHYYQKGILSRKGIES